MEQKSYWEANKLSASQDTPRTLWNPKVRYRIHNSPSSAPILSHIDPVHFCQSQSLNIHYHITVSLMPGSSKWSYFLRFPHQNSVCITNLPNSCYMPCRFIFLDLNTRKILGEYIAQSSLLCSLLHSPVISSLLHPNILLSTLFSKILSLHSFVNMSDQVLHPYKTTDKFIVLYILITKDSAQNDSKHSLNFNLLLISSWIEFWIRWGCFQIFKLFHPFKGFVICLYVVILSWYVFGDGKIFRQMLWNANIRYCFHSIQSHVILLKQIVPSLKHSCSFSIV
jgi:hypothetical protein